MVTCQGIALYGQPSEEHTALHGRSSCEIEDLLFTRGKWHKMIMQQLKIGYLKLKLRHFIIDNWT